MTVPMPVLLTVENRQSHPVDEGLLIERLQSALAAEGVAGGAVTLVLVDDAEIHRINRDHLMHDWPTDVISFSYVDDESDRVLPWPRGTGRQLDGELVISVETAARNAGQHGWSLHAELLLYGVHGLLHLCGYDDLTDEERPLMRRRERELLSLFGLTPQNLED